MCARLQKNTQKAGVQNDLVCKVSLYVKCDRREFCMQKEITQSESAG